MADLILHLVGVEGGPNAYICNNEKGTAGGEEAKVGIEFPQVYRKGIL